MEYRSCRICGARRLHAEYRRVARGVLRICRACESRRAQRWRLLATGRTVPERLEEPDISLGEHLRILEYEQLERRGQQ
jgi:hypothetical protein